MISKLDVLYMLQDDEEWGLKHIYWIFWALTLSLRNYLLGLDGSDVCMPIKAPDGWSGENDEFRCGSVCMLKENNEVKKGDWGLEE